MLTAYVITATDHHFTVGIVELPEVMTTAANVAEIRGAVLAAAAEHTGMARDQFTVVSDY